MKKLLEYDRTDGYELRHNNNATNKTFAENIENDYYKGFRAND